MNKRLSKIIKAILIPGLVFQSVVTGGGFATGREIVQYCVRHGETIIWIFIIIMVSFSLLFFLMIETARLFKAYDYRSWGKKLLPGIWIPLDILFIVMSILVCAIVISGAVEVAKNIIAFPAFIGFIIAIGIVALISAGGNKYVLSTKLIGALLLTFSYLLIAIYALNSNDHYITSNAISYKTDQWILSTLEYVGYNTVALPACLYTFSYVKTQGQSFWSSIISGILLILPMIFVSLSIITFAPESLSSPIPLHYVVVHLNIPFLIVLYYIILVWTLLDTAIGMIYAISGRIDSQYYEWKNRNLSKGQRAFFAVLFIFSSILLSRIGIIDLVAKGYSIMSYCFIILLVIPLLTVGIMKIYMNNKNIDRKKQ